MKKALHKSAFREIRSTMSRFLSIFGIVAIGVGFFAGVKTAAPDMRKTSDTYYDEKRLMDLRLVSTYGFDGNDIDALRSIDGAQVFPSYYTDVVVTAQGRSPAASRIYALNDFLRDELNMIGLTEGRMPENEHECLVNAAKMKGGPTVGTRISIANNSGELPDDILNVFEYEIVGKCLSPMYIDKTSRGSTSVGNGSIEAAYYVPEKNFTVEYNTEVYLRFPALEEYNCYEDDYKERIEQINDALDPIADTRSEERFTDIKREADEELAKAETKLSDAEKEAEEKIADGEKELEDARKKLSDAKQEIEDGEKQIAENEQKLIDGKKELEDAKAELEDGEKQIAENEQKLIDGKKELEDAKAELEDGQKQIDENEEKLIDAKKQLDDARKEIEDGEKQIAENEQKIADGKKELEEAKIQLEDGERQIAENEQKIADGKKELEEAKKQLEDGERQIAENEQKIADGKKELEEAKKQLEDGERQIAGNEQKIIDGRIELEKAKEELDSGEKLINANEQELIKGKIALEEAKKQLDDGEKQIAGNEKLLAESKKELDAAKLQLEAGESQLAQTRQQIADAEAALAQIEANLANAAEVLPPAEVQALEQQAAALRTQITLGKAALPAAEAQLEEGRTQYEAGLAQYNNGAAQLEAAKVQFEVGKKQYEDGLKQTEDGEKQLAAAKAELEAGKKKYEAGLAEFVAGEYQFNSAKAQLASGRKQYEDGVKELADGEKQLEDAKKELADGRKKYEDGIKELEDGEKQLEDAKKELADGRKKYEDGVKELEDGEKQLEDAKKKLADGRAEYEKGLAEYLDGKAKFDEAKEKFEDGRKKYEDGVKELEDGEKQLSDARTELSDGKKKYDDGVKELEDGEKQLADAKTELADGRAEYEDGLVKLADGEKELEDGKAEAREKIDDAKQQLADARDEIGKLEKPKWYIFSRTDNPGYSEYGENSERINNIASVFPVFFLVVAMLVCLTTMSRMVEEQRVQIGTLKALGYSDSDIMFKYMFYAVSATVAGSVIGCFVGMKLFPYVIITAYGMMYDLAEPILDIDIRTGLLSTLAFSLAISATVFLTARGALKEQAAQLMRPKAPKTGKRIFLEKIGFIWNRFNFSAKVTSRNLFRYKRKMFMTVIGISGCTALLLTGFALYDSINDIVAKQYGELQHYQGLLVYDSEKYPEAPEKAAELLSQTGDSFKVYQKLVTVSANGKNVDAYIAVPSDPEKFTEYLTLRERISGESIDFTDGKVIMDEKTTLLLGGLAAGEAFDLKMSDTEKYTLTLSSPFENYPNHYIYMTPATYESTFGQAPKYNTLYFRHNAGTQGEDALGRKILSIDGILTVSFNSAVMDSFSSMLDPLNYVIGVIIGTSGLLAFVVMYNLTNINITERIREIATLKVLGFYDKEVDSYIFRENILLSLLGTGVGLILGIFLAKFIITTAEVDIVMFGRNIYAPSFIYAALMTMAFSTLVTVAMHRRLQKINMIEALKSVE